MAVAGSFVVAGAIDAVPAISIVSREFIYETAPFPSAHASTIVETNDGLVAAWFGGTAEKNPDVGIWVSRHLSGPESALGDSSGSRRSASREGGWSPPVEVANGVQADGRRFPTWNPVLFAVPDGPIALFYKVGPSPSQWWGMVSASDDDGKTWRAPQRLPEGILGPIRAKPVLLDSGSILAGSSTEDGGWRAHMELLRATSDERRTTSDELRATSDERRTTRDARRATNNERRTRSERRTSSEEWVAQATNPAAWTKTPPLNSPDKFGAIQPTILVHSPRRLQILCRTEQRVIAESWSNDGGATWSAMKATRLPNPSAGVDVVKLSNGLFVLAYNPSAENRHAIALSTSMDGVTWSAPVTIEEGPGEYSYPAIIQTRDGLVHMTYTWRRERIRHVVVKIG
jgi:predicted neuraminidase